MRLFPRSLKHLRAQTAKWMREPVQALPPAVAAEVQATFEALGYVAPPDIMALYLQIGGMHAMDENGFRLWPLAEVREENTTQSPAGVLFADYLINCWCYRVRPVAESESAVYIDRFDGTSPVLVSSSLEEFFRSYRSDADAILHKHASRDA